MVAIKRRSLVCPIGIPVTLATADDLDGSVATQTYDITGALRVLIWQINDGTAGTAGVDCVEISHDGGASWTADGTNKVPNTGLLASANDVTGTVLTAGALNAAGVEPATTEVGLFKFGPYEGPTLIRLGRDTSAVGLGGVGIDWVTGAPTVLMIPIGLTPAAITAET